MDIQKGARIKLEQYFNISAPLSVHVAIDGSAVYDSTCFGVDAQGKLSDDRYMIFYNQTASPNREITLTGGGSNTVFLAALSNLPQSVQKLVFTISIDGTTTMSSLRSCTISLEQSGRDTVRLPLQGSDFTRERAIVAVEIYCKDGIWRMAAVAAGFNGGLPDLLKAYGGTQNDVPAPAPTPAPPRPQPTPQPYQQQPTPQPYQQQPTPQPYQQQPTPQPYQQQPTPQPYQQQPTPQLYQQQPTPQPYQQGGGSNIPQMVSPPAPQAFPMQGQPQNPYQGQQQQNPYQGQQQQNPYQQQPQQNPYQQQPPRQNQNPFPQPTPAPIPAPAPPSNAPVVLTKGKRVNLQKGAGVSGDIVINLNWNQKKRGLFSSGGIDLDLGCLFELKNGQKGCVQALGNRFGSLTAAPFIALDGDDRTGANAAGETLRISGVHMSEIKRILVYTFIYDGVANWKQVDGVVTIKCPGSPDLILHMDEYNTSLTLCCIALLESSGRDSFGVEKLVRFFTDQEPMDRAFGWGMSWRAGRK